VAAAGLQHIAANWTAPSGLILAEEKLEGVIETDCAVVMQAYSGGKAKLNTSLPEAIATYCSPLTL
jgi:hypothetical protein